MGRPAGDGPRTKALLAGEKTYMPDRPCKRGHMSERRTATWECYACSREKKNTRLQNDPEYRGHIRAKDRNWLKNQSPEKIEQRRQKTRDWMARQAPEKIDELKARAVERRLADGNRASRAAGAKRKAAKIKRTPGWVDRSKLRNVYKMCPDGMDVDHIIPMQAKLVCGLHVDYNLQYLTRKENRAKGNGYSPSFFDEEYISFARTVIESLTNDVQGQHC